MIVHRHLVPTSSQKSEQKKRGRSEQLPLQFSSVYGNRDSLQKMGRSPSRARKLPPQLKDKMEASFGYDFSSVSITESHAATDIGANAFTQGRNIVFAPGKFDPGTKSGQALLGHELSHVVQQAKGDASAFQGKNTAVVTDTALERQADADGQKAAQMSGATPMRLVQDLPQQYSAGVLQGNFITDWYAKRQARKAEQRRDQAMVNDVVSANLGAFDIRDRKGKHDKNASVKAVKALSDSNARFLSDEEFEALKALSFSPAGVKWLHDHQFYTIFELLPLYRTAQDGFEAPTRAEDESEEAFQQRILEFYSNDAESQFINGENPVFTRYETLPKGARIQLAYIANQNPDAMNDTLYSYKAEAIAAQLLEQGDQAGTGPEAARQYREQTTYQRDAQIWSNVLTQKTSDQVEQSAIAMGMTQEESQDMSTKYAYSTQLLRRLFLLMQVGLGYTEEQNNPLKDWPSQVAAAMSHSGRVIIRLPKAQTEDESGFNHPLMRYLFANGGDDALRFATRGGMFNRHGGTHNISFQDQPDGSQKMTEGRGITGGFLASLFNTGYTHYGLDAALEGSVGSTSLAGDVIMPNGKSGHLYIGVKLPTTKSEGAVQIGAEGDRYGAGANSFGHVHNLKGTAEEIRNAGGQKTDLLGSLTGGRVIDTRQMGEHWETRLRQMESMLKAQGKLTGKSYEQMITGKQAGGAAYMQTGVDRLEVPVPTTRDEYNLLLDILLNDELDLPPSYVRKLEHAIWQAQNAGIDLM